MKAAKYISEFLIKNGITDTFMITGGGAMHLDDAIGHQEGMHCVFNHHEQACAIAAEGYARLTGKIACVCVTAGPGGTNAITGVMGGWTDSIPMLVITGQAKRETMVSSCADLGLRQLGDQEVDIVSSVKCMTKYAAVIDDPRDVAYHLEKALYLAMNGRKGPVWIDVPLDVQGAQINENELKHFDAAAEYPWQVPEINSTKIEEIIEKIKSARAPLVLAGTGIRLAGAEDEFRRFIEKYKLPVAVAWNANDILEYDSPYFAGMPGTVGTRPGNFALQNCDLLISFACRMNIRMIGYNHNDFARNAYKISVDIDPKELIKPTVRIDMPVNADVLDVLRKLNAATYEPQAAHEKWRVWCRERIERYPAVLPSYHGDGLINPYVFIDKLFEKLDENDRVITGNGAACVITFQTAKIKKGQRMFTNSGCAAMGYGFPAAIGAAVSDNSRRTICIDGDGSFMMNLQELATVAYNKLDLKLIILNNNGYLSIRQTQRNLFKPPFIGIDNESGICFPDFGKLSEAFGIPYYRLDSETEAGEVLDKALTSKGPCVIEAVVDPSQNFEPKSSSKMLPDGKMVSTSLDDMAPFLSEEEMKENRYE